MAQNLYIDSQRDETHPSRLADASVRGDDRQHGSEQPLTPNDALTTTLCQSHQRFCGIPYTACHFYFDTLRFLTKSEISAGDVLAIRKRVKHLDIRAHGQWVRPKRGQAYQLNLYPYRFRIEIHLPDAETIQFFAQLPGTILTAAHLARDFVFDRPKDKQQLHELFSEHWVQRWQRKNRRIIFERNDGLSTGRRSRGSYFTAYSNRPSRITGEAECVHQEIRAHGRAALEKSGINELNDLLSFDFESFWKEQDQNSLKRVNVEKLGKFVRGKEDKSRADMIGLDRRLGWLIYGIKGMDEYGNRSVEQFIRAGRGFNRFTEMMQR
jgi:hypothetical protein